MNRRRILYVEATGSGGGSNASLRALLEGLDRTRFTAVTVFGDRGYPGPWEGEVYALSAATLDNFDFFPAGWNLRWLHQFVRFLIRFPFDTVRAAWLLKGLRPALVHCNAGQVVPFGCAARLLGYPLVWHVRELVACNSLGKIQDRLYAACADRVVATSRVVASRLPACRAKLAVVPNCVSPPRVDAPEVTGLRAAAGLMEGDFVVLLLGSELSAAKGYIFLADVADRLASHPRIRFLLAGRTAAPPAGAWHRLLRRVPAGGSSRGAERQRILDRWHEHVAAGRAHFPGYVRASTAIASSTILVCPNRVAEPFGRSFIEGGIQRRPVIAMDLPAFNEMIEHGRTGWLLPPDPALWAETIAALAADLSAVGRAGSAAEQCARTFAPDAHARVVMNLYDDVLRCA